MRDQLRREIEAAVGVLLGEAGDRGALPRFALEPPRLPQHGDFACNAALLLSRRLRRSPREIADRLLAALGDAGGLLARSEAAGPGFLNLWVSDARWREVLVDILRLGPRYGRSSQGKGERVQVEFVSANPTGPLTLGHGRQAVLGDSIARLLESQGYEVTREYYFNDGGRQMRLLGESVRARYLEQLGLAAPPPDECLRHSHAPWATTVDGLPVAFPQGGYQGEYIHEIAAALRAKHGDALAHETSDGPFRRYAQERIFEDIRSMLASLGIEFDVYTNETTLYETGKVQQTLDDLRAKDLVYEADGATWLRATALGLERDRVLIKQSGEPTYLLPDVAYHRDKFRRDFSRVIDVQGADHIEQFPFVRSAVAALSCPAERVELVMHQFVTLTRGGQQVKQSTRRATYVTVGELLDDVGVDVFRFFMVQRKADGHLDFDLDLAKEVDWKKNPAYYVQYAHARTYGIERKVSERGLQLPNPQDFDPTPLELPEEIELVKKLAEYPEVVRNSAETREPHHVAYYLRDVAALWNPYVQDGIRHRILSDDPRLTEARLGLALGVRTVLASGVGLLGLSAPERM